MAVMSPPASLEPSPRAVFLDHLRRGELAYQISAADGAPIFPPRVMAPSTGAEVLWRVSAGRGRVYAVTAVHAPGEPPYNVALVDLDEGFRMLSRVEDHAGPIPVGSRVRIRFGPAEHDGAPVPVFVPDSSP